MKKAFTLIELLVVVLIIGILSAVALPQYQVAVLKSRFVEYNTVAHSLAKTIEVFYLSDNKYPEFWNMLDIEIPGCTGDGKLGDLICNNFYIDLGDTTFVLRDELKSTNRTRNPVHISITYRFLHGGAVLAGMYNCVGYSAIGKKVCKTVCGGENCFYE